MRGMASKGIFDSKYGSGVSGAIWPNIAENLSNCEKFGLTTRSLRDNFTTFVKRCKLKTRREIKVTGLGGEELSENEQVLEDLKERFEESECRTKADTQKR